jgi:hypothetical protein
MWKQYINSNYVNLTKKKTLLKPLILEAKKNALILRTIQVVCS